MHIFHTLFTRGQGGLLQSYLDYTDALLAHGHRVTALVDPLTPGQEVLRAKGVAVMTLRCRGYSDPLAMWRCRRLILSLKPDMLLGHNSRAMTLLRKARGRYAAHLVGVSHSMKTRRALRMDSMIVLTGRMQEHFIAAGYGEEQVYVVPNMVQQSVVGDRWSVVKKRADNHKRGLTIGGLGRFTSEKGFITLVQAVGVLQREGMDVRLLLAGDGVLRAELEAAAMVFQSADTPRPRSVSDAEPGSPSLKMDAGDPGSRPGCESGVGAPQAAVTFSGWVEDKTTFFDAIDVCCVPSLEESFGIVVLEAWAHGVAVVASDADGPASLIASGENGVLFPRGDAGALVDALRQLVEDTALRDELVKNGRAEVEKYTAQAVGKRLNMVLDSCAAVVLSH